MTIIFTLGKERLRLGDSTLAEPRYVDLSILDGASLVLAVGISSAFGDWRRLCATCAQLLGPMDLNTTELLKR